MLKLKKPAAIAFAATIVLAGCSDSDSAEKVTPEGSSSPETPAEPDDGADLDGNGEEAGSDPDGTDENGAPDSNGGGPAAEIDAAPATGPEADLPDYSFKLPEGWEEVTDEDFGAEIDFVALDSEGATDNFANNLNVLQSPAGDIPLEMVEESGTDELEASGASEVEVHDRVLVAGAEASHISAYMEEAGEYYTNQFYMPHDGNAYVMTLSFAPDMSDADRLDIAGSILATWSWK